MLRKFKDVHAGETCVILGSGPSLPKTPRELLECYPTFGANKVFLLSELPGWEGFAPTYYTVIDSQMIHDCTERLRDFSVKESFIRRDYPVKGSNQIRCVVEPGFSTDINDKVIMGGTVTFANLQIAYYMGFATALLLGVDHDYGKYGRLKPGAPFIAEGQDEAHFHAEYFKDGRIYTAPELRGTEMTYREARRVWEADGRRIVNLTPGTQLDVFEKDDFEHWMSRS